MMEMWRNAWLLVKEQSTNEVVRMHNHDENIAVVVVVVRQFTNALMKQRICVPFDAMICRQTKRHYATNNDNNNSKKKYNKGLAIS